MKKIFTTIFISILSFAAFAFDAKKPVSSSPRVYVMMKHGKLIEVMNGHRKQVKQDMTLVNESTIHPSGLIDVSSGEQRQLQEGEYMTMDGRIRKLKDMAHPGKTVHHVKKKKSC